jgi:hypothetical protein
MCLDTCFGTSSICTRRDIAFVCDSKNLGDEGRCQPPTPSTACIPQARFQRGTRQVGECCADGPNGNSGEECDGYRCISVGMNGNDGPFVCSQWCDLTKDCPSGTVCSIETHACEPANFPYTCK